MPILLHSKVQEKSRPHRHGSVVTVLANNKFIVEFEDASKSREEKTSRQLKLIITAGAVFSSAHDALSPQHPRAAKRAVKPPNPPKQLSKASKKKQKEDGIRAEAGLDALDHSEQVGVRATRRKQAQLSGYTAASSGRAAASHVASPAISDREDDSDDASYNGPEDDNSDEIESALSNSQSSHDSELSKKPSARPLRTLGSARVGSAKAFSAATAAVAELEALCASDSENKDASVANDDDSNESDFGGGANRGENSDHDANSAMTENVEHLDSVDAMLLDDLVDILRNGDLQGFYALQDDEVADAAARAAADKRRNKACKERHHLIEKCHVFVAKKNKVEYKWKVVEHHVPTTAAFRDYSTVGTRLDMDAILTHDNAILKIWLKLFPGNIRQQIATVNELLKKTWRKTKVSEQEYMRFLGIILLAGVTRFGGDRLWRSADDDRGLFCWGIAGDFLSKNKFNDIKSVFPQAMAGEIETRGAWGPSATVVENFNDNRKRNVAASGMKVPDESMSPWKPRKSRSGDLPTLSSVPRKPEPLGTELNTVCCATLNIMLGMEIQEGKELMAQKEHAQDMQAHSAYLVRLAELTAQCGRADTEAKKQYVVADAGFGSVESIEELQRRDFEGVLNCKTASAGFPRAQLQTIMTDWPGGMHLVLKCKSPKTGREIVAVAYKFAWSKPTQFLLATPGAGSTLPSDPYVAEFADSNGGTITKSYDRPEIASIYFRNFNKVDLHNQIRQGYLRLEKFWRVHRGHMRIVTTILGITTVDAWYAYRHALGDSHRDKSISIYDFNHYLVKQILTGEWHQHAGVPPLRMSLPPPPAGLLFQRDSTDSTVSTLTLGTASSTDPSSASALSLEGCPPIIEEDEDRSDLLEGLKQAVRPHNLSAPRIPQEWLHEHMIGLGQVVSKVTSQTSRRERGICKLKGCGAKVRTRCGLCKEYYCNVATRCCAYIHICEKYNESGDAASSFNAQLESLKEQHCALIATKSYTSQTI